MKIILEMLVSYRMYQAPKGFYSILRFVEFPYISEKSTNNFFVLRNKFKRNNYWKYVQVKGFVYPVFL